MEISDVQNEFFFFQTFLWNEIWIWALLKVSYRCHTVLEILNYFFTRIRILRQSTGKRRGVPQESNIFSSSFFKTTPRVRSLVFHKGGQAWVQFSGGTGLLLGCFLLFEDGILALSFFPSDTSYREGTDQGRKFVHL